MARNKLEYAGDFEVLECIIHTSEGVTLDVKQELIYLDIFDDIENSAMQGELAIGDMSNMQQFGTLIGQEYLSLHIKVPTISGDWDYRKSFMHINSYAKRDDANHAQMHTLHFISREFIQNHRISLSQSFTGSHSDIVTQLMNDYIKTNKDMYVEPTSGVKKIVAPDINPFHLIEQCKREAISSQYNTSNFFFFETKEGYHFRSLESMFAQGTVQNYTLYPAGTLVDCGTEQLDELYEQCLNYNIAYEDNTVVQQQMGTFASKTMVHDIYNKRWETQVYNYHDEFANEKHMNSFEDGKQDLPLYNTTPVDNDENNISSFPVKSYFMPVSRKYPHLDVDGSHSLNGQHSLSAGKPNKVIGQRSSRMMQIKMGKEVALTVHGNPLVSAGDTVNINFPIVGPVEIDNKKVDRFINGPHLVRRIRHNFDMHGATKPQYTMYMSCVKDSMDEPLEELGIPDQGQLEKSLVITDFYEEDELM